MRAENMSVWKRVFERCEFGNGRYSEVKYFSSPNYKSILDLPLSSTTCLREEPDGQNTIFEDLEDITYFYDFSAESLLKRLLDKEREFSFHELIELEYNGVLVHVDRGTNKTPIGKKLEQLIKNGKKVTHIVRSKEEYGGDTHYSVWRNYVRAEIYEVKDEF